MKTEALLDGGAMEVSRTIPRSPRAAVDDACRAATSLVAGRSGADVDLIASLVERVRSRQPVPFACGAIAWTTFARQESATDKVIHRTARLAAAGALLLPHLVLENVAEARRYDDPAEAVMDVGTPVDEVVAAMSSALAGVVADGPRRTLGHLIELVATTRTLPSFNGKASSGVVLHALGIRGTGSEASRRMIRRWTPVFHLDAVPSVVRDGVIERIETTPIAIERFLKEREDGPPLAESSHRKGQASLTEVGTATGIGYAKLRNYRHLIDEAVASGRVKLGPRVAVDGEKAERLRDLRRRRLDFVDRCIADGIALPISPSHRRVYDFAAIAAMDGNVEGDDLADDLTYTAEVYRRAPVKALPEPLAAPGTTYGQFEKELRRERRGELDGRKSAAAMLSQTMRAFRDFRTINGRTAPSAIIGVELAQDRVEETIEAVATGRAGDVVTNPGMFATNLRIVARIHARVAADDGLGDDPAKAISIALRRSEKTLPRLAAETGISENALGAALHSGRHRSAELRAGLPALERALGCREGRLSGTVAAGRNLQGLKKGKRSIPHRMQDFVSKDWATMDDDEYEAMIVWIDDNIIHQPTPFGRAMSMAVRLGREAARIRGELGYERRLGLEVEEERKTPFQRSVERLVIHKVDVFTPDGFKRRGASFWVDHTARMRIAMLLALGNFVTDPVEAGGLGFDPEVFDLPHLLNVNFAKVYADQMAHRLADVEWGGPGGKKRGPLFTRMHADLMTLLASIFREKWGFAYQQPDMAKAITAADERPLPAIRHLVGTDEVRKVLPGYVHQAPASMPTVPPSLVDLPPEAYREACVDACDRYGALGTDLRKRCKRSRDPIATIMGIVHHDDPVLVTLRHLKLAQERTPSLIADPLGHHLHVRNLACSIFGLLVTFRPRNMRELTCSGPDAQIRLENGTWRIEVPHDRFKNWASTPLFADKSPFTRTLPEIPGFYEIMEYYSERSLPFLVGEQGTPNFFVDAKGQPLTPLSYWRLVHDFTARHLAHNPYLERGIPGVMPFNPYAWRYIRATDILLHPTPGGNPYVEAANALQTSEAMVSRYYGRVRPDARNSKQDERFRLIAGSIW